MAETYQTSESEERRISEEHAHADYLADLMIKRLREAAECGELPKVN